MSVLNKGLGEKLRWFYPIAGALIGTAIVITNAWSIFYPYIMEQYGLTAANMASITLGASLVGFGNFIVAPITAAFLVDKVGPKIMYSFTTILLIAALFCLRMFSSGGVGEWEQFSMYWYLGSFLIGWGCGYYTTTANPIAAKWCADKTGLAIGIVNLGPALGPVWCAVAATALIPIVGMEGAFTVMIGGGIAVVIIFGVLLQRKPEDGFVPQGYKPPIATEGQSEGINLKQAIRTVDFWCMAACTFLCCFGGFCFAMNMSTIIIEGTVTIGGMEEAVVRTTVVAVAISIANILNAIVRPIWGGLATRLGSPWKVLKILYIGFIIALLVFSFLYTSAVGAIFAVCLVYVFFGGTSPLHQSAGPVLFGPKYAGQIMNTLVIMTGIAWILGPYVGGFIKGSIGSYVPALYLGAAFVFVALIIVFYMDSVTKKRKAAAEAKKIEG